jgi:hypothetical protein
MRLIFSAGGEDEIREGIRRIGKTIAEQVELYGALTGSEEGPGAGGVGSASNPPAPDSSETDSTVVPFRKAEGA